MIYKLGKNIHKHSIDISYSKSMNIKYMLISDIHWDNPKCNRELLKKHLDYAKQIGAYIVLNGDTFCLMQGKYDRRSNKNDILPEHLGANYFDLIIEDAVNFFSPYADLMILIGYGNHETAISKLHEFDIIQRFAQVFNYTNNSNLQVGGYGGYLVIKPNIQKVPYVKIRYHHGHGGGGVITKGVIQDSRLQMFITDADIIWQGHVHELYHHINMREHLNMSNNTIELLEQHIIRTATYKEEFNGGFMGFHVERGSIPKPLGCYLLNVNYVRNRQKDKKEYDKIFTFTALTK